MEVTLQSPFPFEALPRAWRWMEGFQSKLTDDFAPQTLREFMPFMARLYDQSGYLTWGVLADGELIGMASFERLSPWLGAGHFLLKPDFHGKGLAPQAARMVAGKMFETGVGKLVFYPFAGNKAIGSLIVYLGGRREGELRSHTLSGGQPVDINMYGLLKSVFEEKEGQRNASATHSIGNRSGSERVGVDPGRREQEKHEHVDADAAPGTSGTSDRPPVVRQLDPEQSHVGVAAATD